MHDSTQGSRCGSGAPGSLLEFSVEGSNPLRGCVRALEKERLINEGTEEPNLTHYIPRTPN